VRNGHVEDDFEGQGDEPNKEGEMGENNTKEAKTINHVGSATSYLVEKGFSAVTLMLSKQRIRLLIHKRGDLRLYLTKMSPNASKICEGLQAHPSHWTGGHIALSLNVDSFK